MISGVYTYNKELSSNLDNIIKAIGAYQINYKLQKNNIKLVEMEIVPQRRSFSLLHREQNCYIVSNARIDNREDLGRKLIIDRKALSQMSDNQLILKSYHKWKDKCVCHLVGDFSFVVWDENEQTLFCARDYIGTRPFYYTAHSHFFGFSTDINGVLAMPQISQEFDEPYIASALSWKMFHHNEHTFFKHIKKLPPAHTLIVKKGKIKLNRYWSPNHFLPISFSSHGECAEAFLEIFQEAVKCRVQNADSIGFHITGGLDSSSVAAMAMRQWGKEKIKPIGFCWQPEPMLEQKQELEYQLLKYFLEQEKIELLYCPPTTETVTEYMYEDLTRTPLTMLVHEVPVQRMAKARNIQVLLSGWGGDEGISFHGTGWALWLLLNGKWKQFYRHTKLLEINFFKFLIAGGILPIFSIYKAKAMQQIFQKPIKAKQHYLHKNFYDKTPLLFKNFTFDQLGKERQSALFNLGHMAERMGAWYLSGAKHNLTYVYPLLDQRIVEFALHLPIEYFIYGKEKRRLMRWACGQILPEAIAVNTNKNDPIRSESIRTITDTIISKEQVRLAKALPHCARSIYFNINTLLDDISSTKNTHQILHTLTFLDL